MSEKQILLVEGSDDEHVIKAIFGQRNLPKIDNIHPYNGITNLLEALPVRLRESDISNLGIVVDADTNISARWESIRNRLNAAGYLNTPLIPDPSGTIINPPEESLLPKVGIWLMPNNSTTGILEDFLRFLIPEGTTNPLFSHAELALETIPLEILRFSQLSKPKALIHTWLAWQDEPGKPLGQSITARFLDHNVREVDTFVAWLHMIFELTRQTEELAG